jgi:Swt1-like HEPN
MTTERETLRRVQDGLYPLGRGLTPFVKARMEARYGANWLHYASRAGSGSAGAALDEYGLLKTMLDKWREVFDEVFGRDEKHRVRNFTSTALEARNRASHPVPPIQDSEALRHLDAMHQLLMAVKASQEDVAELKLLYDEQRRSGLAAPDAPKPEPPLPPSPIENMRPPEARRRVNQQGERTYTPRSEEMVLVGYFLARCGSGEHRTGPPSVLRVKRWEDVYPLFHSRLGAGRDLRAFRNSLQNTRDAFDAYVDNGRRGWWQKALGELEQAVFDEWKSRDCGELWAQVSRYLDPHSGLASTALGRTL